MNFRLVLKSVTYITLILRYFTEFAYDVIVKRSRSLLHPDEFLVHKWCYKIIHFISICSFRQC